MHKYSYLAIWCVVSLLLVFANACSDPDKSGGPGFAAPTVLAVAPPTGAEGVCTNTIITATFSEAMNPATIDTSTFTLTGPGGTTITGVVTYNAPSNTATFTPTGGLDVSALYTATITTGVRDAYGNALLKNYAWTFTTGIMACTGVGVPTVVSATPGNGACPDTLVTATFSEAMDPATINGTTFTLTGPGAAGTVTYDVADESATFTPSAPLALSSTYTATITTGAQDLFGNGLATDFTWMFTTSAVACQATVPLGSAADYEALGGSTVTNTGPTVITGGNLGLSPGSAVIGFPPGTVTPPGVIDISNPAAAQAELDLTAAYNYAAGAQGAAVLPGDLSGLTLAPGVYKNSSTVMLSSGVLTLDASSNPNGTYIFQIGSTLTTLGSTQVVLAGGAQAANIFWQVSSSATLGTNSIFEGNILAFQSITLDTGATLNGRALARNGAVTLDDNAVNVPALTRPSASMPPIL